MCHTPCTIFQSDELGILCKCSFNTEIFLDILEVESKCIPVIRIPSFRFRHTIHKNRIKMIAVSGYHIKLLRLSAQDSGNGRNNGSPFTCHASDCVFQLRKCSDHFLVRGDSPQHKYGIFTLKINRIKIRLSVDCQLREIVTLFGNETQFRIVTVVHGHTVRLHGARTDSRSTNHIVIDFRLHRNGMVLMHIQEIIK